MGIFCVADPSPPPRPPSPLTAQVCGEGEGIAGDCVVPLGSALLPGARQVVLDGVFHSMSRIGTFDEESGEGLGGTREARGT